MSMDDSKPGGLFYRMARFVRHPAMHWSEGDVPEDPHGPGDRQVLRQTLERKRRNDLVRQREFEQLRRLRLKEAASVGPAPAEATSQPATLHGSVAPPDSRAVTLQKIDAIEEQISQQWWRKKQPADASTMPMYLVSTFPRPDSVHVAAVPPTPGLASALPLDWNVAAGGAQQRAAPTTGFATTLALEPHEWSAPVEQPAPAPFLHDPDLEEAAMAFANGSATQAEAALLAVLAQRAAQPALQYPVWLALFDLYRAAGLADRFEELALEFAARFGRAAPPWFSLSVPGVATPGVDTPGVATPGVARPSAAAQPWHWSAPAVLTRAAVAALQQSKAAAAEPWMLSWRALERIEDDAAAPLERLFCEWAQTPGLLVFVDAPVLAQCLQALTVSGERAAPEAGWRLRLAALRLMEQPDSFELVALDYCVTYEVAPPSWTPPRSSYREGLEPAPEDALPPPPAAALAGCLDGDATPWLTALEERVLPGLPLVVDCAALVRLDFAAAGALLNWAARLQDQGVGLRFERLHQLLAVFLGMVGVGEHAQLVPRSD